MLTITVEPQCGQYIGDAVREAASVEQVYRPSSDKATWCKELAHRIGMKANMERQRHIDMAKELGRSLRRANHAAFVRHMSKGMKS